MLYFQIRLNDRQRERHVKLFCRRRGGERSWGRWGRDVSADPLNKASFTETIRIFKVIDRRLRTGGIDIFSSILSFEAVLNVLRPLTPVSLLLISANGETLLTANVTRISVFPTEQYLVVTQNNARNFLARRENQTERQESRRAQSRFCRCRAPATYRRHLRCRCKIKIAHSWLSSYPSFLCSGASFSERSTRTNGRPPALTLTVG